jgi:predicted amidophosphoribosyltransferase
MKAVTTMNTTQPIWATTRQQAAPTRHGLTPVCWCGQDLDRSGRVYCPRCGTARSNCR